MKPLFDGRPDINIHICENGWIVYAYSPYASYGYYGDCMVFNTARELANYIQETAKTFEDLRTKQEGEKKCL